MQLRMNLCGGATLAGLSVLIAISQTVFAAQLPVLKDVEWQPFAAQVKRLVEAADYVGSPLSAEEKKGIEDALKETDPQLASEKIQGILDPHCLFGVQINPEMRVKVAQGAAKPELMEQGWRAFLVKVQNESGATSELRAVSPNAVALFDGANISPSPSDQFYKKKRPQPASTKPED